MPQSHRRGLRVGRGHNVRLRGHFVRGVAIGAVRRGAPARRQGLPSRTCEVRWSHRVGTTPAWEGMMNHTEQLWTLIALVGVALLLIALALGRRRARARTERLQQRFGPEYDVALDELGTPALAERELDERARRVAHFKFKDLSAADRARFASDWLRIQAEFVDDPAVAVTSANELINEVMRARGYPTQSFEQRVADLSVEHPTVIQHYRAAHELSRSVFNGTIDTEPLRQALVHYRMLFTHLLHEGEAVAAAPAPLRRARAL